MKTRQRIWRNIWNSKRKMYVPLKNQILPSDFCDESFRIVDEFIRKTKDLDYEILLFFDYKKGKIIDCKIGDENGAILEFNEEKFKGKNIASIHNHTKDMYTPHSHNNFGIFLRTFEHLELIAGWNGLWILEGKITNEKLNFELNIVSKSLFNLAQDYSKTKSKNSNEFHEKCDENYGQLLSEHIKT